ncbi:hypothetical protein ACIRH0_12760 [Streptomyces sp. NPDC093675]|uniref:hypothetical protein n=1 Tax=Streptomyces sp. NPDC093675 TaxID=3366049 RepID=UPI0037F1846F
MSTQDPHAGNGPTAQQLPDRLHAVGPGWHPLLLRLHEELLALDPGYQVDDLKEKLGGARIRIATASAAACAEMRARVGAAEEHSTTICEFCGAPGRRRTRCDATEGWIKAVCEDCHRAWSHHTILIINGSVHSRKAGRG